MSTDHKTCAHCGEEFTYSWVGVGELYTEICLDCMVSTMGNADREEDQRIAASWMNTLNA